MNLRGRLFRLERRVPPGSAPARLPDEEWAARVCWLLERASWATASAETVAKARRVSEILKAARRRRQAAEGKKS
jgi:hypothetical protein